MLPKSQSRFVAYFFTSIIASLSLPLINSQSTSLVAFQDPGEIAPNDETDKAKRFFRKLGASLTEDSTGKIVGFQLPESRALAQQAWLRLEKLKSLQDLDLAAQHLTNDSPKSVGKLTQLRTLNLFGNPLDSIALTHLTGLEKLETLYMER